MLVCRQQTFVSAPAPRVWDLVGQPDRHPEWWPEIVEVQGSRFGHGCSYCQVVSDGEDVSKIEFTVERLEELRELLVRCAETGMYLRWLLTEAQGGTFVDAEFGIDADAATVPNPDFDADASRDQLRRWLHSSLDGLAGASVARG